ncbi:MAG: hypothetical protein NVS2B7_10900 [Herpetosiphon sp.]
MYAPAKNELEAIKELIAQGDRVTAKERCQAYLRLHPTSEPAMIQLLMLDPTPLEEIAILESFLHQYPDHRFAVRFTERLSEMRIVALISELSTEALGGAPPLNSLAPRGAQRIGEFLVAGNFITLQQLESALAEQQRSTQTKTHHRLGTILVMQGFITADQLSAALSQQIRQGFGELGDYLVRVGAITAAQLKHALELQSHRAVQVEQNYQRAIQSTQSRTWGTGLLNRRPPAPPKRPPVPRLGDILVELGVLTERQLTSLIADRDREFFALFG